MCDCIFLSAKFSILIVVKNKIKSSKSVIKILKNSNCVFLGNLRILFFNIFYQNNDE